MKKDSPSYVLQGVNTREIPTRGHEELMARALAIFLPDVGLALYRAFEAQKVATEIRDAPVLDLGCGDGRFAALWARALSRPPRVVGCEMNPLLLKEEVPGERTRLSVAADGCRLPMKDGCVGAVIANSVLAHVPEINELLAEVARVLKEDGKFLVSVPGPDFEDQLASVRIWRKLGFSWMARRAGDHYHLKWRQWHRDGGMTWRRRLQSHGLSLEAVSFYPSRRAGFAWSLAFNLMRAGLGRLTPLNILLKLQRYPVFKIAQSRAFQWIAPALAPLLRDRGDEGGSLFLIARRTNGASSYSNLARLPRPSPLSGARLPDRAAALEWLRTSKIRVRDEAPILSGGYGNLVDGRTGNAPMLYCEITGYASQFWLRQDWGDSAELALAAGESLLRIQETDHPDSVAGAFPYGLLRPYGNVVPGYFSFDAAVCAAALMDLFKSTNDHRFAEAALRVGEFLLRMQRAGGSFKAAEIPDPAHAALPKLEPWFGDGCVLHGKNAIALLKLWSLSGQARWREAALRTLEWLLGQIQPQGNFPSHEGAETSVVHTHCYATEGLFYAGLALGEERFLTAGLRAADWLRIAQRRNGGFHWEYIVNQSGVPSPKIRRFVYAGPVAQAARLWWVADRVSPRASWAEAATRALGFLARVQLPADRAAVGGAFPQGARSLAGLIRFPIYSPWEAMFASEAARLWEGGDEDPTWSLF